MEWRISDGLIDYDLAVRTMEDRVAAIRAGEAGELVWLLQHPPLYTAGTSAKEADLLDAGGLPVYRTGRGGQYTYHGPGQRIAYVMLDLQRRKLDIRCYVAMLEDWLIATLKCFSLRGERREGRIGIWIDRGRGREDKIGAIGVRVRRWVTYHGISLNVEPDLSHYAGIVPCGIREGGVTSLVDLGLPIEMAEVDVQLANAWRKIFAEKAVND
ncbi:MAG: lipoyl(octanoyl) transferase LipB [Alphaproteobacteria bacterium]